MKVSMECDVIGRVYIGEDITIVRDLKEYTFKPDDKGWLKSISIIKSANRPDKYSRRLERGNDSSNSTLRIDRDYEEYLELRSEFQELESLLSFETLGSIKSIAWDSPNEIWFPETDEEQKRIQISGIKIRKDPAELINKFSEQQFSQIITNKEHYISLIVPKAFFREGLNEFHTMRYINAFYSFYFIIEDIYGEGSTSNIKIANACKKSHVFKEILQRMLVKIAEKEAKIEMNIRKLCIEEQEKFDIEGIINLIRKIRNNLHHYSNSHSKHHGTPFNHADFEGVSFLMMGLAYHTINRKIEDIAKLKIKTEK